MALLNCPDCGQKVSDTAENCVNCGCDLILYKEGIRIDKEIEEKVRIFEQNFKKPEQIESLSDVDRYRNEDSANYLTLVGAGIMFVLGIAMLFLNKSEAIPFGIGSILVGGFFVFAFIRLRKNAKQLLEDEKKRIQARIDNFEKNKKIQVDTYRASLIEAKKKELKKISERKVVMPKEEPKGIHCPMCKATSYEKISILNRVVSIELVGLASNKIGKQYKCKKCGHLW